MAAYRICHAVGDLARVGSRETSLTRVALILVLVVHSSSAEQLTYQNAIYACPMLDTD